MDIFAGKNQGCLKSSETFKNGVLGPPQADIFGGILGHSKKPPLIRGEFFKGGGGFLDGIPLIKGELTPPEF